MSGVSDAEHVWRDVYFNNLAKYLKGSNLTPNSKARAFFGTRQSPKGEISGNLYDRVSLSDATAFGDQRAAGMEESKTVKGWWKMPVLDLRKNGCLVKHTPQPENDYHADVVIPDGHYETWEDAEVYLLCFLANGTWQDRAA